MTQEEKSLLLKDLCGRLLYGVKYCRHSWNYEWGQEMSVVEVLEDIDKDGYINYHKVYKVEDIKPYLRSLSSMTEEENEKLKYEIELELQALEGEEGHNTVSAAPAAFEIDFYNKHHFDYRGLIEKGLALEAPEEMYK